MASKIVNGFPDAKLFGPPGRHRDKGKFLPKGQIMTYVGLDDLIDGIDAFAKSSALPMRKGALHEIGLFGEAETKIRTPVKYGVLRASIGHYTSADVKGGDAGEAEAGAVWELTVDRVEWGTNVEYAPWIEDGFTMATRRAVWFDDVQGFRMVNPFSYRGAHMFAGAVLMVEKAAPHILGHWIEEAMKAAELGPT